MSGAAQKEGARSELPRVWLNGRLLPAWEAHISPFDHGLTTGDGIFESLVTKDGEPFALTRHWRRLQRSGEIMGLKVPGRDELAAAIREVLRENGKLDGAARVRVTVTGGPAPLGSDKGEEGETVIVAVGDVPQRKPLARVRIVPFCRNERSALTGVKSTSYGENVVALALAKTAGAQEAIFGNTRGEVCEGTGSNIFLVLDGRLLTPPLESGCLEGVTRSVVLDACRQSGIACREQSVPLAALAQAQEAFLTSTFRNVQPICAVDDTELPQAPGPVTTSVMRAFQQFVERNFDPS
jgi:branched-chain amino acid aminotransferase